MPSAHTGRAWATELLLLLFIVKIIQEGRILERSLPARGGLPIMFSIQRVMI